VTRRIFAVLLACGFAIKGTDARHHLIQIVATIAGKLTDSLSDNSFEKQTAPLTRQGR